LLHIDLQSGFHKEPVIVRVNGREVFRDPSVTTQRLLGVAREIELPHHQGPARVEVELEKSGLTKTVQIDAAENIFLGISLEDGKIMHIISKQPFGYA
jgi:hypothetical protein